MRWRVNWNDGKVASNVATATARAIDATMAEAVSISARRPVVPYRYGVLQRSIKFDPAKRRRGRIAGRWGAFSVNYALAQEIGIGGRPGRYYLRTGAQRAYPKLQRRIREELAKVTKR